MKEVDDQGTLSQDLVVRFKLHFLLTIVGTVIATVIIFINLRNDVVQSLHVVAQQQIALDQNREEISQLKIQLSVVNAKLDYIKDLLQRK